MTVKASCQDLKDLDGRRMAPRRSKATVPCHQRSPQLFGEHDIGRIVGRQVVTQFPDARQEDEMSIPIEAEIQQIAQGLVGTAPSKHPLPHKTPQHLGNLKV